LQVDGTTGDGESQEVSQHTPDRHRQPRLGSVVDTRFPRSQIKRRLRLKGNNRFWEELMVHFAAVLIIFNVVFWLFLFTVAGLFVFALICETIESIRDHNRRAVRIAAEAPAVRSILEGLIRRLRHSLPF
jgi:hypothetical protein